MPPAGTETSNFEKKKFVFKQLVKFRKFQFEFSMVQSPALLLIVNFHQ